MTKRVTTIALAAAIAAAAPATAAPVEVPASAGLVPAGKIEHSIVRTQISGRDAAAPSHVREERYLSRHRARSVMTDVATGRVKARTLAGRRQVRYYGGSATPTLVEKRRKGDGLPFDALSFDAAVVKAQLDGGRSRVVGEEVRAGRRVLVVRAAPGRQERETVTTVIDAGTGALLERTVTRPDGRFTQREVVERYELLPAGAPQAKLPK